MMDRTQKIGFEKRSFSGLFRLETTQDKSTEHAPISFHSLPFPCHQRHDIPKSLPSIFLRTLPRLLKLINNTTRKHDLVRLIHFRQCDVRLL